MRELSSRFTRVLILVGLNRPWGSLRPKPHGPESLYLGATCWSFNGPEPGGLESTIKKQERERGRYPLVYEESQ